MAVGTAVATVDGTAEELKRSPGSGGETYAGSGWQWRVTGRRSGI